MSESAPPVPPPRGVIAARRPTSRIFAATAFALAIALATLQFGEPPATTMLDPSWTAVMSWGIERGARWGRDLVFTHGPLGFLVPHASYWESTFGAFRLAQIALAAVQVFLLASVLVLVPRRISIGLATAILVSLPWWVGDAGRFATLAFGIVALDLASSGRSRTLRLALVVVVGTYLAALALMKATFLPVALALYAIAFGIVVPRFERVVHALVFPLALVAGWVGTGQDIVDAPAYLRGVVEISAGYAAGMGLVPAAAVDAVGLATLAATVALLLRAFSRALRERDLAGAALSIALGGIVAAAWRAAYTRADAHVEILFPLASLVPLLLLGARTGSGMRAIAPATAATILAVLGLGVVAQDPIAHYRHVPRSVGAAMHGLFAPTHLAGQLEREATRRAALVALPRTRSVVGDEPVDLFMYGQGVVFRNGMRYAPRPVFQSYAAVTPWLARLNERHYLGQRAPRFVLFRLETLDRRWPGSDDSLAMLALWWRYTPRFVEGGYALLERVRPAAQALAEPGTWRVARLGEWIDVPDGPATLHADASLSLAGRAYATLLRGPLLLIEARLRNGETERYRLVRGIARAGMLVSPRLGGTDDFVAWLRGGEGGVPVAAIRLVTPTPSSEALFSKEFRYAIRSLPRDATIR